MKPILSVFLILALCFSSLSYAITFYDEYTMGPYGVDGGFFVEGHLIQVARIEAEGAYSPGLGACRVNTAESYTRITRDPPEGRSVAYTLYTGDAQSFTVTETTSGEDVTIRLTLTKIEADFTPELFDDVWYCTDPTNEKVTLKVEIEEEIYYCEDNDGSDPDYVHIASDVEAGVITSDQGSLFGVPIIQLEANPQHGDAFLQKDYCVDGETLYERICMGSLINAHILSCEDDEVCANMRCVDAEFTCEDTDPDNKVLILGDLTRTKSAEGVNVVVGTRQDECEDVDTVKQYNCIIGGFIHSFDTCSDGYVCDEGICVEAGAPCADTEDCAISEFCVDGECVMATSFTCEDTDGGSDPSEYGITTRYKHLDGMSEVQSSQDDVCIGETSVNEAFCDDGYVTAEPLGCPVDTSCVNGECVAEDEETEAFCEDSDDGDLMVKGTTTSGLRNAETLEPVAVSTEEDTCAFGAVREYSCIGTTLHVSDQSCPAGYGCDDGRCVVSDEDTELFCEDSDEGEVPNTAGTVRAGSRDPVTLEDVSVTEVDDECLSSDAVREYTCDGTAIESTDEICSANRICSDGRCMMPSTLVELFCEETDSGRDITHVGTITWGTTDPAGALIESNEKTDECLADASLMEYYCDGDDAKLVISDCDLDQICHEGACMDEEDIPPGNGEPPTPPTNQTDDTLRTTAETSIQDAVDAIAIAEEANKNVTEAQAKLEEAEVAFDAENYEDAITLAGEAETLAIQAPEIGEEPPPGFELPEIDLMLVGGALLGLIILGGAAFWFFTRPKTPPTDVPPTEPLTKEPSPEPKIPPKEFPKEPLSPPGSPQAPPEPKSLEEEMTGSS